MGRWERERGEKDIKHFYDGLLVTIQHNPL